MLARDAAPRATRGDADPRASRATMSRRIEQATPAQGRVRIDQDTAMSPGSYEAALRAAGGAVFAVDEVMTGKVANAFVATRPPGHHAETRDRDGLLLLQQRRRRRPPRPGGARRRARRDRRLRRPPRQRHAAYLLGRQERALRLDPRDAALSRHRRALASAASTTRSSTRRSRRATAATFSARRWRPRSCRASTLSRPTSSSSPPASTPITAIPLGNLQLREEDFAWATRALMEIAARRCGGRLVSLMEGGYDLQGLSRSVAAHVRR